VLGHEAAGVVVETGSSVESVGVGDHVIVSCISPCRLCPHCLRGETTLCDHSFDSALAGPYGTSWDGPVYAALGTATFGEETIIPEVAAIAIDPDVPLDLAALIGCCVATGVGAVVNSAGVHPGETVGVVGCGGVGLAAIQGARASGASRIVAVDRIETKLKLAIDNGATHTVFAEAGVDVPGAVREVTEGRGVDHAFEVVGLSSTIRDAYGMARRGGTVTVVGAGAFDDLVSISAMQLMVDGKTIRGCVYGSSDPRRDFPRLLEMHRAGVIDVSRLISRRIRLDEVNGAFEAMLAGEVARSVIVFD
jgi:S-(hydroxymethyl)glutathione dehydrogenase/alcohol dehydrogenase